MDDSKEKIKLLKDYFLRKSEVSMAFLFGSYAKDRAISESDFDVAVYFKPEGKTFESEEVEFHSQENEIWSNISSLLDKEVDLVCLNYAPTTLISNVFKTGIPLIIKDRRLYWELYLQKSLETEDFLEFAQDYWEIYKKAKSLGGEEKVRVLERLQFLDTELKEIKELKKITFAEYKDDKTKRRNIERWVENIINATIDIAKIILASEKKQMPQTYAGALLDFAIYAGLTEKEANRFSSVANLRNILAHQYLDILYGKIQDFINEFPPLSKKILNFLDDYLKLG